MVNLMMFNHPLLPGGFKYGNYAFTNYDKSVLEYVFQDKVNNLTYLAKLTAAAYCSNVLLHVPTVVYADNTEKLNNIKDFISCLFCGDIYTLDWRKWLYPEEHLEDLVDEIFCNKKILCMRLDDEPNNLNGIKTLANGFYMMRDYLKFKNNMPVVIFTTNPEVCDKFKTECTANIVDVTGNIPINKTVIGFADYISIRQSLLICGLHLFDNKTADFKSAVDKQTVVERFFWNFIIEEENQIVVKSDLREAFNKYLEVSEPKETVSSLAICDFLASRGHNVRSKKRVYAYSNPVAVVKGITIDHGKPNRFLEEKKGLTHHDIKKFNKILEVLEKCTL